jgi:hypothetical protein
MYPLPLEMTPTWQHLVNGVMEQGLDTITWFISLSVLGTAGALLLIINNCSEFED